MKNQILPLVNWGNGIIMIVIFALVCIGLVTMVVLFLNSGDKKDN